jgi:hypothetical protein
VALVIQPASGQPFRGGRPGGAGGGVNGGAFNGGGVNGRGINGGGVNGGGVNGNFNGGNFNGGGVNGNFNGGNFNGGAGGPIMEKTWSCSNCKREVARGEQPPSLTRCPFCGVKISYIKDENGIRPVDSNSSSSAPFSGGSNKVDSATVTWVLLGIGGAVVVILLIVGGIVLLVCLSGGNKKRPKRRRRFDADYDYGY